MVKQSGSIKIYLDDNVFNGFRVIYVNGCLGVEVCIGAEQWPETKIGSGGKTSD